MGIVYELAFQERFFEFDNKLYNFNSKKTLKDRILIFRVKRVESPPNWRLGANFDFLMKNEFSSFPT